MNYYVTTCTKVVLRVYFVCVSISVYIALTSAVTLDYSNSNLASIPKAPEAAVRRLHLQHNCLEELRPDSFINYTELRTLDLSSNPLRIIHDGIFDTLYRFRSMIIFGGGIARIAKLPSDFGPSTPTLKTIILSDALDKPDIIIYPYFMAFTTLENIHIGWNNINPPNASILPPKVKSIVFDGANINKFPDFALNAPNVNYVSIKENKLMIVPQEYIENLTLLEYFNARHNKITHFPNFNHCVNLVQIIMDVNKLSSIPRGHIMGLMRINYMDLNKNVITTMPDISNLTTLKKFKIGFNQIPKIPHRYITGLLYMKVFDCQGNDLTFLPNIYQLFPQLQELYVQGNHLTVLPDLHEIASLGILHAADNPYVCNQSLCWLRMLPWMRPSVTMLQDDPICEEPDLAAGTRVLRYHPSSMKCYKGTYTYI